MVSGWRIVGLAAIVGLLGSVVAGLALTDTSGTSLSTRPAPLGDSLRLPGTPQASETGVGLQLLREAALACQDTSYSGFQVVLWWGKGETSASVVEVWHQPGRMTLVQAASGAPGSPGPAAQSGPASDPDPDGILGMSAQLLNLLQANYQVIYVGRGSAGQRSSLIVEVLRPGGSLAARFWLDAATKLPLRREMFGPGAQMISDDTFTNLELGDPGPVGTAASAPWPAQLDQARLAALRAQGWQLPGQLAGNLALFAATEKATRTGEVVNLTYSDGLAVVSLFVQRGELGRPGPGWHPVTLHGRTVYSVDPEERTFTWSAGGFVYTLVADAPMQTVSQVVATLPGGTRIGFWQRIGRGLHRLASWVNPLR
jgi:hypothetical protein